MLTIPIKNEPSRLPRPPRKLFWLSIWPTWPICTAVIRSERNHSDRERVDDAYDPDQERTFEVTQTAEKIILVEHLANLAHLHRCDQIGKESQRSRASRRCLRSRSRTNLRGYPDRRENYSG